QPTDHVLPNAPMYAPRMSAGARAATTACEVGTHSISPITKSKITNAIVKADPFTFRSRNGTPISGIATPSLSEAGIDTVQRVSLSWKKVTSSGLTIINAPQAAGARWWVVVAEIGSRVSVATYVIVAKTDESMKSKNGESRMITANEPRCGGPSGAYAPPRGMKRTAIANPADARTNVPIQRWSQSPPIR